MTVQLEEYDLIDFLKEQDIQCYITQGATADIIEEKILKRE